MTPADTAQRIRAAYDIASAAADADLAAAATRARALGEARAERLVAAAVQGTSIHHARVGRLLRGWYVECYEAGLARALGQSGVVDRGAAEVELKASQIAANVGATEGQNRRWPFYMAAGVYRRGLRDGAAAGATVWSNLRDRAAEWSLTIAPAERSDVSGQILQQWYRRCFLAAVNDRLGLSTDLRRVTAAEVEAVVRSVAAGETVRLVHPDGVPVMTQHNTRTTRADRRLDAGAVGIAQPSPPPLDSPILRQQVERRWDAARPSTRASLARDAGLPPVLADIVGRIRNLTQLDTDTQTAIRHAYVDRLTAAAAPEPEPYVVRDSDRLDGPPDRAAAEMFALEPAEPTQPPALPDGPREPEDLER